MCKNFYKNRPQLSCIHNTKLAVRSSSCFQVLIPFSSHASVKRKINWSIWIHEKNKLFLFKMHTWTVPTVLILFHKTSSIWRKSFLGGPLLTFILSPQVSKNSNIWQVAMPVCDNICAFYHFAGFSLVTQSLKSNVDRPPLPLLVICSVRKSINNKASACGSTVVLSLSVPAGLTSAILMRFNAQLAALHTC